MIRDQIKFMEGQRELDGAGLKDDVNVETLMLKMNDIGKCKCGHYEDEHIGLCAKCKECNEFKGVKLD